MNDSHSIEMAPAEHAIPPAPDPWAVLNVCRELVLYGGIVDVAVDGKTSVHAFENLRCHPQERSGDQQGNMTDARSMAIGFGVLIGVALLPFVKLYALRVAWALWCGRDEPSKSEDRDEDGRDDSEASEEESEESLIEASCLVVELRERYINGEWDLSGIAQELEESICRRTARSIALACGQLLEHGLNTDDQAFFETWLDPRLQLSCANWGSVSAKDLAAAQVEKMEAIARRLELEPGMRVLVIECGWGGLACYLAKHHGVIVTGVSRHNGNVESARTWAVKEGVADRTRFMEGEPSEVHEAFDRVVCVSLREIYHTPSEIELEHLLRFNGKALVHQVALDRVVQHTQVQHDAAAPAFIAEVMDITQDLFATVRSWICNISVEWSRGSLQAFVQQKRAWEFTLRCLALASSDHALVLQELVYTKTQHPRQRQAHDDATPHKRT